jgi:O-antigen/teichoic acid export membrane protein
VRVLGARFLGYTSADGLSYALGFVIYALLIRVLTNRQYGELSIATTLYQALMMVTALGLDLTGPKLIAEFGGDPIDFARKAQRLRIGFAFALCAPLQFAFAFMAWHKGRGLLAGIIVASFAMVLARAWDLTYVAVAAGLPGPVAKTRALGLGVYLVVLALCIPIIRTQLWLVPVLNAFGVTLGRLQLGRILRRRCPEVHKNRIFVNWEVLKVGLRASTGQLALLLMQTGDVLLLSRYVSTDVVGQYAMVSRLYLLGTAVLTAMLNTFLPEIVHVAHDAKGLKQQYRIYVAASLVLAITGWALFHFVAARLCETLAHRVLPTVNRITPTFALVFLLLAVANPFLSMLPSLHRSTEYVIGVTSAVALLFGLDLVLMPRYGAVGAARGQAIAMSFLALYSCFICLLHIRSLPVLVGGIRASELAPPILKLD